MIIRPTICTTGSTKSVLSYSYYPKQTNTKFSLGLMVSKREMFLLSDGIHESHIVYTLSVELYDELCVFLNIAKIQIFLWFFDHKKACFGSGAPIIWECLD